MLKIISTMSKVTCPNLHMIFPSVLSSSLVPLGSNDGGIGVTGGETSPTLPSGNSGGKVRIKIVTEESVMLELYPEIKPYSLTKMAFLCTLFQ